MLTVRYDTLGVRPGDRLLDLGCGGGRHAYEALRRGAWVTALDSERSEVAGVAGLMAVMTSSDELTRRRGGKGAVALGRAGGLPFPSASFDRVIAAEVLEHIPDDDGAMSELSRVLRPGGTMAVTVPRWWPERVSWTISDEYHDRPGGHVRIYRRRRLLAGLRACGLEPYRSHHAHALHSPFWWLRCAVGVDDDSHPLVRAYHRVLVWDITAAHPLTRLPEAILNPVLGKSAVFYLRKRA
ncbi:MAG: class I SAM-dependent methyltransferase [Acidimicrobiales bacterium]